MDTHSPNTRNVLVNKRTVTLILVAYLTIIWAAVIFRIDHFPLTWVPMYSVYQPSETISTKYQRQRRTFKKGFVSPTAMAQSVMCPIRI